MLVGGPTDVGHLAVKLAHDTEYIPSFRTPARLPQDRALLSVCFPSRWIAPRERDSWPLVTRDPSAGI